MNTPMPPATPRRAEILAKLMRILSLTEERELSCPEAFQLVDYYAELELAGENVHGLMPRVAHHLHLCGECFEEYVAVRRLVSIDIEDEADH